MFVVVAALAVKRGSCFLGLLLPSRPPTPPHLSRVLLQPAGGRCCTHGSNHLDSPCRSPPYAPIFSLAPRRIRLPWAVLL